MIESLPLLAADAAPGAGGGLGILPFILIMFAMMYFIMIRPQRKQQKAQEQMRSNLRVGDKVVSIGGIHGMISGMTDRTVSVKVADGMSIKFDRTAIASVEAKKSGADEKQTDEEASKVESES